MVIQIRQENFSPSRHQSEKHTRAFGCNISTLHGRSFFTVQMPSVPSRTGGLGESPQSSWRRPRNQYLGLAQKLVQFMALKLRAHKPWAVVPKWAQQPHVGRTFYKTIANSSSAVLFYYIYTNPKLWTKTCWHRAVTCHRHEPNEIGLLTTFLSGKDFLATMAMLQPNTKTHVETSCS